MEQTQTTFSFFITSKYKWANSITLGTFLYLFIAVFLPFGVSNYNPNHTYTLEFLGMLSSFMVATSIVAGLNEFFLKPLFVKRLEINAGIQQAGKQGGMDSPNHRQQVRHKSQLHGAAGYSTEPLLNFR